MAETVVILGAGATKACKGPLTNEILPEVFLNKADFPNAASLTQLEQFLQQNFHVATGAPPQDYPGLPLLMSLIDTAIERRQTFHPAWDVDAVTQLRHAMELVIFDLLEYRLEIGASEARPFVKALTSLVEPATNSKASILEPVASVRLVAPSYGRC